MRFFSLALLATLTAATSAHAAQTGCPIGATPGTPYNSARAAMIRAGFVPVTEWQAPAGHLHFAQARGWHEIIDVAATGPALFQWSGPNGRFTVSAQSEGELAVIACRPDHPPR